MKKTTLNALINYLTEKNDDCMADILAELEAERTRGQAKAKANREAYDEMHTAVMEALASAEMPVTAQELADETGLARGKIVYGLTNYWADEVVKTVVGKSTAYSAK